LFGTFFLYVRYVVFITSAQPTRPDGSRTGPVCHTSRGPYGIPGGRPPVAVRGGLTGPRRDGHPVRDPPASRAALRTVPVRVPADFYIGLGLGSRSKSSISGNSGMTGIGPQIFFGEWVAPM